MHQTVEGGCLCGRVRFRVRGPFQMFHLCHCSQCRKATGSAHASNIFTAPGNIDWLSGKELIRHFQLRGEQSFTKCFCGNCGSALPYLNRSGKYLVIPAGTLDDDPGIRPQDNIFWRDRAAWYEAGLGAQHYDGYPD